MTDAAKSIGLSVLDWAAAVLYNGLGRYQEACSAALRVAARPHDLNPSLWVMAELIEAAVRAGSPEVAADTHQRLVSMTRASGTNWALGVASRSGALLVEGPQAEDLYVEANDRLGRTGSRSTSRVPASCMASGCDVSAAAQTRAWGCTSPMSSSPTSEWRPSRSGRESSCSRQAGVPAGGPLTRSTSSRRRRRRSPTSRRKKYQSRDRRSTVHQPEHGRVPPAQGVSEARRETRTQLSRRVG